MRWHSMQGDTDTLTGGGIATVFRDVLMNQQGILIILAVVFLINLGKPSENSEGGAAAPGNVVVESFWPSEIDADVDQIVRGPKGPPVMYSNLVGVHYNLLRDDLGKMEDDPVNYEVTYSRGLPPGEHCVNLHLYSNKSNYFPIKVQVHVTVNKGDPGKTAGKSAKKSVLTTEVFLKAAGQEMNVFCFFLDNHGNFIGGDTTYSSATLRLRSPDEMFGPP